MLIPDLNNIISEYVIEPKLKCIYDTGELLDMSWVFSSTVAIDASKLNPGKLDQMSWKMLSQNTSSGAFDLLELYPSRIEWDWLSRNPSVGAIKLLTSNQDKINWRKLSLNSSAINLLTANQDKIVWMYLSFNSSAIKLLTANHDKIDWMYLSFNTAAIELARRAERNARIDS